MKKRFTDSDIWKKAWFRKLPPPEKALWYYIKDQCDNVGVWEPDKEAAEFNIGCEFDWDAFPEKVNDNLMILPNGKWFLVDFCFFQHPDLKEDSDRPDNKNKAVASYIRDLKVHGLWEIVQGRLRGVQRPLDGRANAPKEREQEGEEEREKVRAANPLLVDNSKIFESSRAYWNSHDNLPQYPYMPLQIPVDKYRNALNAMSPFGAEEINSAIANYSRLLPRLRFKYGTFLNFMTSGLVQFVDSAKPDELFPEDEKTAEERRQAEAWEKEKQFRRERGEDI
jgi:hypothetical protein